MNFNPEHITGKILLSSHQSVVSSHLIAGYPNRVLLRDFSLALPAAPTFGAVLGHNGAGKTTLFRVLTG